MHQQYFVYNYSKSSLKLKCKQPRECPWSLSAAKQKGDDLCEPIEEYGPSTVGRLIHMHHEDTIA